MRRAAFSCLFAVVLTARGALAEGPANEPEAEAWVRAVELQRKGTDAFAAGQYEAAYALEKKAFELHGSASIARDLGHVEIKLRKLRDAAEHIALFLSTAGPEAASALPAERAVLADLKKSIGTMQITANVRGARIRLDGVPIGAAPLATEIYVDPGEHSIQAEKEGYRDEFISSTVAMGAVVPVKIVLHSESERGASTHPIWPTILLGGVAAVGIGVGIGFTVVAQGKNSDAQDIASGCPGFDQACVDEGQAAIDDANTFQPIGIIGFSIGAAALVGALVYQFLPRAPSRGFSLVPVLDANEAGFVGTVRF